MVKSGCFICQSRESLRFWPCLNQASFATTVSQAGARVGIRTAVFAWACLQKHGVASAAGPAGSVVLRSSPQWTLFLGTKQPVLEWMFFYWFLDVLRKLIGCVSQNGHPKCPVASSQLFGFSSGVGQNITRFETHWNTLFGYDIYKSFLGVPELIFWHLHLQNRWKCKARRNLKAKAKIAKPILGW